MDVTAPAPRRLGETSSLEARVAALERIVAQLLGAADQTADAAGEDGSPRRWLPLAEAAQVTGYSPNGLRGLVRRGKALGRYRGPHLMVAVDTVPARRVG
jgi:hypothetical protein